MAGSKSSMVVFMVMMVAAMQMQTSMAQTRHVVGDAMGWNVPANGAATYTTWASGKNFTVGDTLFFNFTTGSHDVAEVSQAAYGPCTTSNPISSTTTGPATITLTTAGTHYYICTVGAHCSLGQKVSVNVVSAATTPPPAAAPTTPPPAATPTVPPPAATPTPAPVSPPTTTPTPAPAPGPSTTTPPPTSSPAPSPNTASPPAPPTSGPSPSSSTTPSPSGDNTPTPPSPSSAARSFTAVVPATLLVAVFALFF